MKKICVLGAGSWGSALALSLAKKGYSITMWTLNQEQADKINTTKENIKSEKQLNRSTFFTSIRLFTQKTNGKGSQLFPVRLISNVLLPYFSAGRASISLFDPTIRLS